jgi:Tol biopolymer transport system component
MIRKLLAALMLCIASVSSLAQSGATADSPRVFGEGVFSTDAYDLTPTFTPDGRTAFFTVSNPSYRRHTILVTQMKDGKWQTPEVAPFSGRWSDADPFVSVDGSKVYFISNRPASGNTPKRDYDIYYVEKSASGWGEPKNIGAPINSDASELYVTLTNSGAIYFITSRPDGLGQGDIYRSLPVNGKYEKVENLGPAINTPAHDTTPYISPDESYMIFASSRPNGHGDQDLYISYRRDGAWSQAENLGPKINSAARDYCPLVSPDGKSLYFSSDRGFPNPYDEKRLSYRELMNKFRSLDNGLGNVYQIDMAAVKSSPAQANK